MQFHDTPLMDHPLVEAAFNIVQEQIVSRATHDVREYVTAQAATALADMYFHHAKGETTEEEFLEKKDKIEAFIEKALKQIVPPNAQQTADHRLVVTALGFAMAMQEMTDNASPELVAAALLVNNSTFTAPAVFKKVQELLSKADPALGPVVAETLAEVWNVNDYPEDAIPTLFPGTELEAIAAANPDSKRILLAQWIQNLSEITMDAEQTAQTEGAHPLFLRVGELEDKVYNKVKAVWGNDKTLDAGLVKAFNAVAESVTSLYRVEAVNNELKLVALPAATAVAPKAPQPTIQGDTGLEF